MLIFLVLAILFGQGNAAALPKIEKSKGPNVTGSLETASLNPNNFNEKILITLLHKQFEKLRTVINATNEIMDEIEETKEIYGNTEHINRCGKKSTSLVAEKKRQVESGIAKCIRNQMDKMNKLTLYQEMQGEISNDWQNDEMNKHSDYSSEFTTFILEEEEACDRNIMDEFRQSLIDAKKWFDRCSSYRDRSFTEELKNFLNKILSYCRSVSNGE